MTAMLPPLSHGAIQLEPLGGRHRAALKAACAVDDAIWSIYSIDLGGARFDSWFDSVTSAGPGPASWLMWAVVRDEEVVGMTGLAPDARHPGVVEVGTTYYLPRVRGTGLNRTVKWLVLGHVFGTGAHRVEFRVDDRNARSKAAVARLGARLDGLLRRHKITHSGHIRDTNIFSILDTEWPAIEPRLRPQD
jgi:RimJ/RimL family protein N-acetyltransferase